MFCSEACVHSKLKRYVLLKRQFCSEACVHSDFWISFFGKDRKVQKDRVQKDWKGSTVLLRSLRPLRLLDQLFWKGSKSSKGSGSKGLERIDSSAQKLASTQTLGSAFLERIEKFKTQSMRLIC